MKKETILEKAKKVKLGRHKKIKMKKEIFKKWYIKYLKEKSMEDFKCESDARQYFGEEPFNNQTTGNNDNNWHWKTIGQGEGIQKVERDYTYFECKWIAICIGIVSISLIIAGYFTKKDLNNFGNNLPAVVPAIETKELQYTEMKGIFYAYTPRWQETDNSPLINASGHRVQLGDIANNCLPFGTQIKVGDTIYTVKDRMNSRYGCEYFDILFFDLDSAKIWGRKELNYTIIK